MATPARKTNEGRPRAGIPRSSFDCHRTISGALLLFLELAFLAAAVMRILELHFLPVLAVLDFHLVGHERLRISALLTGHADGLADRIRQRLRIRRQRPRLA